MQINLDIQFLFIRKIEYLKSVHKKNTTSDKFDGMIEWERPVTLLLQIVKIPHNYQKFSKNYYVYAKYI